MNNQNLKQNDLPSRYRPLSMWEYFGYQILFSLPFIGFVFLIIFAFSSANINRRNFARSFFCVLIIAVIIVLILFLSGIGASIFGGLIQ